MAPGPGVDVVAFGHEFQAGKSAFDVAVSGECFEHDLYWRQTFTNMVKCVRPGGLVVFTCASLGRPEHGTTRTDASLSPGTQQVGIDYYRNLSEDDFSDLPLSRWFSEYRFWYMPTSMDLYFVGVRSGEGETTASLPLDDDVQKIRLLMSGFHKAVRLPLRFAPRVSNPDTYQDLILPYWNLLLKVKNTFETRGTS